MMCGETFSFNTIKHFITADTIGTLKSVRYEEVLLYTAFRGRGNIIITVLSIADMLYSGHAI